jgi:hypothetical protein
VLRARIENACVGQSWLNALRARIEDRIKHVNGIEDGRGIEDARCLQIHGCNARRIQPRAQNAEAGHTYTYFIGLWNHYTLIMILVIPLSTVRERITNKTEKSSTLGFAPRSSKAVSYDEMRGEDDKSSDESEESDAGQSSVNLWNESDGIS